MKLNILSAKESYQNSNANAEKHAYYEVESEIKNAILKGAKTVDIRGSLLLYYPQIKKELLELGYTFHSFGSSSHIQVAWT